MNRRKTVVRLMKMIRSLWGAMTVSILMRALNHSIGIAIVSAGAWGVSQVLLEPKAEILPSILAIMVVAGTLKGVFRYLEHFTGHYVAFHLLAIIRNKLYQRLEPLAPAGLMDTRSGDVISCAIADVDRIEVFYAHTIAPTANAILVPALALRALTWFEPSLAWTLLPSLVGVGLIAPWASDRLSKRFSLGLRKRAADVSAHLTDSIQGLREIVAFGYEGQRRKETWTLGQRLVGLQKKVAQAAGLQDSLTDFFIASGILSTLGVGLWLVGQGQLNALYLPPVLALATTAFGPVLGASNVIHDFNQAMAAADRLFTLMDQPPEVRELVTSAPPVRAEPSIHFDDVFFHYPAVNISGNGHRETEPLQVHTGLTLDVPAGRTVALVGPSGCGKSTAVNLMLRFWDVDQGHVRIGQHDVRDFPLEELRRRIAVVAQHTHIFNATIRENILLGKPTATDAEIKQSARLANIHDFIASIPDGYETSVGEMGVKLSGGQRQRLAIARALLKDAPILMLDEATSNLDAETEREIQTAIHRLMRGRTTLIIAHRLSTVVNADKIFVMNGGRIVERGTHAELLALGGVYARLFARQQDELLDDEVLSAD